MRRLRKEQIVATFILCGLLLQISGHISIQSDRDITNSKNSINSFEVIARHEESVILNREPQRVKQERVNLHNNESEGVEITVGTDKGFNSEFFSGSGTVEDPYTLENLTISYLYIAATTKHFKIQNCTFISTNNSNTQLKFWDIEEGGGMVVNNTFKGDNIFFLVSRFTGEYVQVQSNTFYSGFMYLKMGFSKNIHIENNNFTKTESVERYEVHPYETTNITITNNFFHNLGEKGILLEVREQFEFSNNHLYETKLNLIDVPLDISFTSYTIENNTVNGKKLKVLINEKQREISGHYGQLILIYCEDIIIHNTTFIGGITGLDSQFSTRIQILNSYFSGINGTALIVSGMDHFICNNTFLSNKYAIQISDKVTITYNTFRDTTSYALIASWYAKGVVHSNNFFHNNPNGSYQALADEDLMFYDVNSAQGNYWSDYDGSDTYVVFRGNPQHGDDFITVFDYFPSATPLGPYSGLFIPPWEEEPTKTSYLFFSLAFLFCFVCYRLRRKRI